MRAVWLEEFANLFIRGSAEMSENFLEEYNFFPPLLYLLCARRGAFEPLGIYQARAPSTEAACRPLIRTESPRLTNSLASASPSPRDEPVTTTPRLWCLSSPTASGRRVRKRRSSRPLPTSRLLTLSNRPPLCKLLPRLHQRHPRK